MSSFNKIIVLCNEPHTFEAGVCISCENDKLKAENEALRKDAERYRHIRDNHKKFAILFNLDFDSLADDWIRVEPKEADTLIDKVMKLPTNIRE